MELQSLATKKPVSVYRVLSNDPFNYLKIISNYQIMLWLISKDFFLKKYWSWIYISKDILRSLFKITHNPLLIVETNTGPISSVSGWVSISKSAPGETYYSKPVLHKNNSYCKLRPLWLQGVCMGISQHLSLEASWNYIGLRTPANTVFRDSQTFCKSRSL